MTLPVSPFSFSAWYAAAGGRLVDVVDDVDLAADALQQVLHLLLGLGLVALGERAADDERASSAAGPCPRGSRCGAGCRPRRWGRGPSSRSAAALLPIVALTYWPSSLPACSLFVAYVAATALAGSVAVSRAMTTTPASWAFLIASSTPPELLGVMRMPLTPCWTRFSMAVTWPALSPSNLPARAIRLLPSFCGLRPWPTRAA